MDRLRISWLRRRIITTRSLLSFAFLARNINRREILAWQRQGPHLRKPLEIQRDLLLAAVHESWPRLSRCQHPPAELTGNAAVLLCVHDLQKRGAFEIPAADIENEIA